jgi:hypothetical protein
MGARELKAKELQRRRQLLKAKIAKSSDIPVLEVSSAR